ncbi:MAG: HD-GYP domain-containing protein [Chloroflexi bacterium]|nr:HD-GYP domain-containing protein [Chloroflexota bacterium]
MSLPPTARAFLYLMVLLAAGLYGYWHQVWRGVWPGSDPASLRLMALFFALAVAAQHFPLTLAARQHVNVAIAPYFAALLLFGAPAALLLVGASQLAGGVTLAARRYNTTAKRVRGLRSVAFNTAQAMSATGLAALVYFAFAPQAAPAQIDRIESLWAIPAAAVVMYLANSFAVAAIVGLQMRDSPLRVWLNGRRKDGLQFAGLLFIGLVTARTAVHDAWFPLVMVLPVAIIYLSLKRTVQLVEQTIAAVEAMADVVDRRDHYTYEHSRRVADYAVRTARCFGMAPEDVELIRLAARVHDLGNVGIPDTVLLKPGRLTPDEQAMVREHPRIGWEILARFPEYGRGRELVLHHHERFDGTGYPHGVDGGHLHLGAQVIAAADAFDAMTSDRPYRPALSLDEAFAELRRYGGTQWHPDVVTALERAICGGPAPTPATPVKDRIAGAATSAAA